MLGPGSPCSSFISRDNSKLERIRGSELAGLKREKEFLGIADVADLGAGVEGEKLLNMWTNTEQKIRRHNKICGSQFCREIHKMRISVIWHYVQALGSVLIPT